MVIFITFALLQQQNYPVMGWVTLTLLALGYHFTQLFRLLHENRSSPNEPIAETFGLANGLSIGRGVLNSLLAGFLFLPFPDHYKWLPAILWTISALIDIFDGIVARVTNRPTLLGATLDMRFDTAGVLIITLLLTWWRQLPFWFVLIGLARPLYVAGLAWRKRRDLPVYALTDSKVRRPMAGVMMGFMTVALWPIVTPPETMIAAYLFGVPFCVLFLRDWLVVSGVVDGVSAEYRTIANLAYKIARCWLPLIMRFVVLSLFLSGEFSITWASFVGIMAMLGAAMVGVGIIGRLGALILLVPAIFAPAPLAPRIILLTCACWLTLFGNGNYSLWLPEEKLFDGRLG